MEWFSQNWVWVLFFIGMIAMHMFGPKVSISRENAFKFRLDRITDSGWRAESPFKEPT